MRYILTVDSKGRITIPAAVRKRYGLVAGTVIRFEEKNGKLILTPCVPKRSRLKR